MEKEKRQASALTLAAKRRKAQALISNALSQRDSANASASSADGLAEGLADTLAGPQSSPLGRPLSLKAAADLIGCSPWTVRQKLLKRGLPFLRSAASGKLIFYEAQIVRWIEKQQGG